MNFVETHLSPRNPVQRMAEIKAFTPIIDNLVNEPVLMMGDMNCIMPSSKNSYDETELIAQMRGAQMGFVSSPLIVDCWCMQWFGVGN